MDFNIRELYYELLDYDGTELFGTVLKPWVEHHQYSNFVFSLTGRLNLSDAERWELYALSRILDTLCLPFLPNKGADSSSWLGPNIYPKEYLEFIDLIGLEHFHPKTYDTFNCEIIESKEEGENNFKIVECLFPTVKLKNLLIKRAGVVITNNKQDYNLDLVNNATIYWAFRRKNRKYLDLSQGWGSNSQWRTEFRLDIETEKAFVYNFNGKLDLNALTDETVKDLEDKT